MEFVNASAMDTGQILGNATNAVGQALTGAFKRAGCWCNEYVWGLG